MSAMVSIEIKALVYLAAIRRTLGAQLSLTPLQARSQPKSKAKFITYELLNCLILAKIMNTFLTFEILIRKTYLSHLWFDDVRDELLRGARAYWVMRRASLYKGVPTLPSYQSICTPDGRHTNS